MYILYVSPYKLVFYMCSWLSDDLLFLLMFHIFANVLLVVVAAVVVVVEICILQFVVNMQMFF